MKQDHCFRNKICSVLILAVVLIFVGVLHANAVNLDAEKEKSSSALPYSKLPDVKFIGEDEKNQTAIMQQQTVSGRITDSETGEPMPGVNIQVKGTNIGAITDPEGKYTLQVSDRNVTLIFSFIGYVTQEIAVAGRNTLDIGLVSQAKGLDEVVVIGYGTAKKSDLTGSLARVNSENFKNQPITQVTEMLTGTVAGFSSVQGTRAAGGGSLEIRGQNSLSAGTDPLLVLDGVIYNGSLRDINPMDIESIDILKDASSAAIFGAKAASGVVLITTTKGLSGKPQITFSTKLSLSEVTNKDIRPFGPEGFTDFRRDFLKRLYPTLEDYYFFSPFELPDNISVEEWRNYSSNPNSDPTTEWLARLQLTNTEIDNYLDGKTVNWYDKVIQKGFRQSYDVNIKGGSDRITYYWSLGSTNNEGIIAGDKYAAIRSRLNISSKITDFLTVGSNTQFAFRDESDILASLSQMINNTPYGTMYNDDGTLKWYPNDNNNAANPLLDYSYQDRKRNIYNITSSIFAEVTFPLGISYKLIYQPRFEFQREFNFWPTTTINGGEDHNQGYGTREEDLSSEWMIDNLLKWNKKIGIHNFDVTLLYNAEKYQRWNSFMSAENFSPNQELSYHALQSGSQLSITNNDTYSTGNAWMGRLNYSLLDKYLITSSVRQDGYSAFGIENKKAIFPAFAFAWQVSKEDFWNTDWLVNRFKLRLSWGINGNRDIGIYSALARLAQNLYYNGSQVQVGVYNSSLANTSLAWEKTTAYNAGIDLGIIENRIDISADFYKSTTKDLLMLRNLPKITGFSNIMSNLGELANQGFELTVNTVNTNLTNFTWNSNLVFSLNRNEIKKLFGDRGDYTLVGEELNGELPDYTNKWFPGHSIDRVWGYEITGVWQVDEAAEAAKLNQTPGDYKVTDLNKDGIYGEKEDKQFIGYKEPQYRLGLRNDITFLKQFSASMFIRADLGHIGRIAIFEGKGDALERRNTREIPYWTAENPTNEYCALKSYTGLYSGGLEAYFPRSFVRIQDLSLSYSLPGNVIDRMKFDNLRLYCSVRNLYSFDKWMDWDPESGSSPMPRTYTFGVDLSF